MNLCKETNTFPPNCLRICKQTIPCTRFSSEHNRKCNTDYPTVIPLTCVTLHRENKWCVFWFLGRNCDVNHCRSSQLIRKLTISLQTRSPCLRTIHFLSNLWHEDRHGLHRVLVKFCKFEAQVWPNNTALVFNVKKLSLFGNLTTLWFSEISKVYHQHDTEF